MGELKFGLMGTYRIDEKMSKRAVVVYVHSSTVVSIVCENDMSFRTSIQIGSGVNEFTPDE